MPVDEREIRRELERLVQPVADPGAVVAAVERRAGARRRRAVGARVLVAAAVLAVVGVAGALLALPGRDGGDGVAAVGGGTAVGSRLDVPPVGEADAALLDDGTPVWVVAHDDGEVVVVDARSTHRPYGIPHLVGWCPTSRGFEDPAYGSQWEPWGHVAGGPAPAMLQVYPTAPAGARAVRVTGPATTSPEPPLDTRRGPLNMIWPDCPDDESASGWVSYASGPPEPLQPHDAGGLDAVTLEEAVRDHEGEVVLVDGSPIIVGTDGATACFEEHRFLASLPPTCDGLDTPQASPLEGEQWAILAGPFLARAEGGALSDVTLVTPATTRSGAGADPSAAARSWCSSPVRGVGMEAELLAAVRVDGEFELECWVEWEQPNGDDVVVVGVRPDGSSTTIRTATRSELPGG